MNEIRKDLKYNNDTKYVMEDDINTDTKKGSVISWALLILLFSISSLLLYIKYATTLSVNQNIINPTLLVSILIFAILLIYKVSSIWNFKNNKFYKIFDFVVSLLSFIFLGYSLFKIFSEIPTGDKFEEIPGLMMIILLPSMFVALIIIPVLLFLEYKILKTIYQKIKDFKK